jgi:hypothetical protein
LEHFVRWCVRYRTADLFFPLLSASHRDDKRKGCGNQGIGRITRRQSLRVLSGSLFANFAIRSFPAAWAQTLYQQSLEATLTQRNPHLEFVILDLKTNQTLVNTFGNTPIPPGSLLKPFLALAYLTNPRPTPFHVVCRGHADLCWKPHGTLTLPEAIAQSCNAYFLALARTLQPDSISLPGTPPPNPTPADLIGLTPRWTIPPQTLARAYAQLVAALTTPRAILEGMRFCAQHGTAAAISRAIGPALAKTGTAPCEGCKISGDGLVLAAVPATNPTLLALIRRRATNGATAALDAARLLTQLKALHAY